MKKWADDKRVKVSDKDAAKRAAMSRAARPFLASTVVITRGPLGAEEVLLGFRSRKHDFMPEVYVYPGGRVDRSDSFAPYAGQIDPRTARILGAALPPARIRACVLAGIRETFEETGLIIGRKAPSPRNMNDAGWDGFHAAGYLPAIDRLSVFGRATTPPYRPKRFDTWFFHTHLTDTEAAQPVADSVELLDIQWAPLKTAHELKMHVITESMIGELRKYLAADSPPKTIPFSRWHRGGFKYDGFPAGK